MPGLVNTHTHMPMTLFRGLADDLPLDVWLNQYIFPAEGAWINPENVRLGTALACAEMLLSGTTTVCGGYFYEDAVAEIVSQAGIRGVLGQGVIDFPAPGVPDAGDNINAAVAFTQKWNGLVADDPAFHLLPFTLYLFAENHQSGQGCGQVARRPFSDPCRRNSPGTGLDRGQWRYVAYSISRPYRCPG